MLLRCAALFLFVNVVRTSGVAGLSKDFVSDVNARYSLWPSIHHGMRLMTIRKREVETQTTVKPEVPSGQAVAQANSEVGIPGASEGQSTVKSGTKISETPVLPHSTDKPQSPNVSNSPVLVNPPVPPNNATKTDKDGEKPPITNKTVQKPDKKNTTSDNSTSVDKTNNDKTELHNATAGEAPKINLSDPGVVKRAAIVFGGFALLATAYYFFIYRKKANTNDAKNTHSSIDPNQFRYGVLQSEDKRSNMELSRVPLTMESDEDDDEDLEIFDLGQKKKSLSYINLQQHDEDIVLNDSRSIDMENLLVDIDDTNTDTLINWSGNGSKSVL
ncbi:uncharacterized protein LOC125228968 [Leguminivora glycinivorella]|uniref:uncharacterized protein LOC125228968 n=1 Tax=Leguminivora glycinivorella TaxID=1035111 RepID=UPI00200D079A|nr:uncharacterized protein LOC125228968 [Leguminivora glycinivorella]